MAEEGILIGHTVVGIFQHSGDADLAAAHLRDAYTLDEDELDLIDEGGFEQRSGGVSEGGGDHWMTALLTGGFSMGLGDMDPIAKRWGDQTQQGKTLVVARSDDPERAQEIAAEMRRAGADRVDLLPH